MWRDCYNSIFRKQRGFDKVVVGNINYWDAFIAATMIENKIFNIYTENTKDFLKIDGIKARNPFV